MNVPVAVAITPTLANAIGVSTAARATSTLRGSRGRHHAKHRIRARHPHHRWHGVCHDLHDNDDAAKMRVLVCGSRNWRDGLAIQRELVKLERGTTVIEGEARGADRFARLTGEALGWPVLRFPADWNRYGKAAGVIRNKQMLDEGKPDLVLAFHEDIYSSKGTADMVRQARRYGIEVKVFES